MRRVCYISGTRADFGLMKRTLTLVAAHPALEIGVVATGMHLSPAYGETVREIEEAGLPILARVPVDLQPATGAAMARGIGVMTGAFVDILEARRPDIVLLLGDRGEMLAGAIAAIHLNIPVAHIHGGERSGTVDEPVRHAISRLSHLHFAATEEASKRLVGMGEDPRRVHVTGAPGLDELVDVALPSRAEVAEIHGVDAERPIAMMAFHPVLQEADTAAEQTRAVLQALLDAGLQVVALAPNADAGSDGVRAVLEQAAREGRVVLHTHLPRPAFVALMARADLMIGNSSAGIIEAASFGTPVVNVGSRQNLRERNLNVVDAPGTVEALASAVNRQLAIKRYPQANIYGDGRAGLKITQLLASESLDRELLSKANRF